MEGLGTQKSPFVIKTLEDLNNVRNNLSAYYILNNNINISTISDFIPIGSNDTDSFNGYFNGNGFKIINLNITTFTNHRGLFGCVGSTGIIENLGVENAMVNGGLYTGILAGRLLSGGIIRYCYTTGIVNGSGTQGVCAGIVGFNQGNINNCFCKAVINNGNATARVGGICGRNGTIDKCYFVGNINVSTDFVPYAIAPEGTTTKCYYDKTIAPTINSGSANGRTTEEMSNSSTFVDWDFNNLWEIRNGYPMLKIFIKEQPTPSKINNININDFNIKKFIISNYDCAKVFIDRALFFDRTGMSIEPTPIIQTIIREVTSRGQNSGETYPGIETFSQTVGPIGRDWAGLWRLNAFRFTDVSVPKDSIINNALFKIGHGSSWTTLIINIHAHDVDNSSEVMSTSNQPKDMLLTETFTVWDVSKLETQEEVDITNLMQEMVSKAGWKSGNDVTLVLVTNSTTATNTYRQLDSSIPQLEITFETTTENVTTTITTNGDIKD